MVCHELLLTVCIILKKKVNRIYFLKLHVACLNFQIIYVMQIRFEFVSLLFRVKFILVLLEHFKFTTRIFRYILISQRPSRAVMCESKSVAASVWNLYTHKSYQSDFYVTVSVAIPQFHSIKHTVFLLGCSETDFYVMVSVAIPQVHTIKHTVFLLGCSETNIICNNVAMDIHQSLQVTILQPSSLSSTFAWHLFLSCFVCILLDVMVQLVELLHRICDVPCLILVHSVLCCYDQNILF